jgi:ABC-type dipeptide/oligopeptide/nickel transport system permease component
MSQLGMVDTTRLTAARKRVGSALLRIAVTALAGGLLSAMMVRFSPGFGLDERQLDAALNRESQQAARRSHDAERDPLRFYADWCGRVLHGDLGFSQSLNRPIRELLSDRAPATLELTLWGIAYAWLLAIVLSIPCLVHPLRRLAAVSAVLTGMAASLPAAAVAILLFRFDGSAKWMLALILFPRLYLYARNVLHQAAAMPHVLFARAKGVRWLPLTFRHILKPSWTQLIALAAVSVNMAFGAAIAIEAICDIPGLGQLAWKAAAARDLTVLVALTVLIAILTQMTNLMADFCTPTLRSHA